MINKNLLNKTNKNQLNNSTSKQLYSFTKADRFHYKYQQDQSSFLTEISQPLPQVSKRNLKTYSIPKSQRKFQYANEKWWKVIPGPGKYNTQLAEKKKGTTIGSQTKSEKKITVTPGPSTYRAFSLQKFIKPTFNAMNSTFQKKKKLFDNVLAISPGPKYQVYGNFEEISKRTQQRILIKKKYKKNHSRNFQNQEKVRLIKQNLLKNKKFMNPEAEWRKKLEKIENIRKKKQKIPIISRSNSKEKRLTMFDIISESKKNFPGPGAYQKFSQFLPLGFKLRKVKSEEKLEK